MVKIGRLGFLFLVLVWAACGRTAFQNRTDVEGTYAHPREAFFSPSSQYYDYYEGTFGKNRCTQDPDCLISGCSRSTCAAEVLAISDATFCQERAADSWPAPQLSRCGCLAGVCQWYFEDDYGRACSATGDCTGLGPPPGGMSNKEFWTCVNGQCQVSQ